MVIREKINQLDKWATGRHLGLVILAQQFAIGAEPLFKWVKSIKVKEKLADYEIIPPLKKWLSLYEDQRHLEERLIEILKGLEGNKGKIY